MQYSGTKKVELVLKQEQNSINGTEITLRNIMEVIFRGKWFITLMVIISMLLSMAGYMYLEPYKGSASMIISFNFDGIEKGLDPYGNNFDISKMKAPTVLSKVVNNLGLAKYGISADDLGTNIELVPIIPGDVTEKIKSLEEAKKQNIQDVQDYTYYPNRYTVTLSIPKSFPIEESKARDILDELYKQYQEYFFYSYSDRSILANAMGPVNYDKYDYPEMSSVIRNQVEIIKNYLTTKNKEIGASDFRSKKTGFAFADIIDSIDVLEKVDLQRIDSIIQSYNLTKDKVTLIKLYEHRVQESQLQSQKKADESRIYADMVGKYQKDKKVIILSGANETQNSVETNETSKYYDNLMDKSVSAGVTSRNALYDIAYYNAQIARLMKDKIDPALKTKAEKDVLALLPDIKSKLQNWIDVTNNTVQEFYESQLYSKAMTKLSPAEYKGMLSVIAIYLAIGLAGGLAIGILLAFLKAYWRKSSKPAEQSNSEVM